MVHKLTDHAARKFCSNLGLSHPPFLTHILETNKYHLFNLLNYKLYKGEAEGGKGCLGGEMGGEKKTEKNN